MIVYKCDRCQVEINPDQKAKVNKGLVVPTTLKESGTDIQVRIEPFRCVEGVNYQVHLCTNCLCGIIQGQPLIQAG